MRSKASSIMAAKPDLSQTQFDEEEATSSFTLLRDSHEPESRQWAQKSARCEGGERDRRRPPSLR